MRRATLAVVLAVCLLIPQPLWAADTGSRTDPDGDPLGIVAHAEHGRTYSLPGIWGDRFEVWLCNTPGGTRPYTSDRSREHNPDVYALAAQTQMQNYFMWLSGGRYAPRFYGGGVLKVGESDNYLSTCLDAVYKKYNKRAGLEGVLVVHDSEDGPGGRASCGRSDRSQFPDNHRYVVVKDKAVYWDNPTILAHELGHALCWPHSYSGETEKNGEVYEYDNPADMMGWVYNSLFFGLGTLAVNRYAAGWIHPDDVVIWERGTTRRYWLAPPNNSLWDQLLVVPLVDGDEGLMYYWALDVRVWGGGDYTNGVERDQELPKEGVVVYEVDQRESACDNPWRGYCSDLDRRVAPLVDDEDGYNPEASIMGVGDWWQYGIPDVRVEVIERDGDRFLVEVSPAS